MDCQDQEGCYHGSGALSVPGNYGKIWIVKNSDVPTMDQGLHQCQVIMERYGLLRIGMWPPWISGFISAR